MTQPTQAQPSTLTRFRLWWEAMDAALVAHGQPPLDYGEARMLFDCDIEPEDVPEVLRAAKQRKTMQ
jgi:hypothetical protein